MNRPRRVYDFRTQDYWGQRGARILDGYFRRRYQIEVASLAEDRRGIDRIFIDLRSSKRITVEYKTDRKAHKTLRAFIETMSDVAKNRDGWALTAQANWLVYFILFEERAFLIRFDQFRQHLPDWRAKYEERLSPNHGYYTKGIIVPISALAKAAQFQCSIPWKRDRRTAMPRTRIGLSFGEPMT